jgi:glycosyltransferase involved in cell wall biosynthesis
VDSVLAQTYTNLEIILVDDGNLDNCGKICDEYVEKDKRVTVVHKENGGLSDARNAALDIMKGEYVAFVDSDDYVAINYIEYLHNLIVKYMADISVCNYLPIKENGIVIKKKDTFTEDKFYSRDNYKKMFSDMFLYEENIAKYNSAYAKLYKKNLFNDIRYPKGKLFEDTRIIAQLLQKSENVIFGKEKYYFYLIRQNSIMGQNFSSKNFEFIDAAKEMCESINNNYQGLEKACERYCTAAHIHVLRKLVETENFNKKEACLLRKEILKNSKRLFFDSKVPKRDKYVIFILLFGAKAFSVCWKIYAKFTNRK